MKTKNNDLAGVQYPGRLNNVIFPVWFVLVLIPPFIFLFMLGNLFIDSLVITIVMLVCKCRIGFSKYLCILFSAFVVGYVSDFIGVSIIYFFANKIYSIDIYNSFANINTFMFFVFATIVVSLLIMIINYTIITKISNNEKISFKISLALAIFTAPWMFFIPYDVFKSFIGQ